MPEATPLENAFSPLPAGARSVFPRGADSGKPRRRPKPKVALMRVTRVQVLCPDRAFLERLQRLLAEAQCPVEADRESLSLTYSHQYEKEVARALGALKKDFEVKIEDQ